MLYFMMLRKLGSIFNTQFCSRKETKAFKLFSILSVKGSANKNSLHFSIYYHISRDVRM